MNINTVMSEYPEESYRKILLQIKENKQEHIFHFWDELSKEEKEEFLKQLKDLDIKKTCALIKELKEKEVTKTKEESYKDCKPPKIISSPTTQEEKVKREEVKEAGEELLRKRKVGIVTVAGGQGTRLGFKGPKGCYKITPIKHKSLFQRTAEYILALEKKYNTNIPWYIMTSDHVEKATEEFFKKHDFFGLEKAQVTFFKQGNMPTVTEEGKFLLEKKNKILTSPNGHGGFIRALTKEKLLDKFQKKELEIIFYHQIDNVLTKIADPVFLGMHKVMNAEIGVKVSKKEAPDEKVGHLVNQKDQLKIIEYSQIPQEMTLKRTEDGELLFSAANTGIHSFSVSFLKKIAEKREELDFHIARRIGKSLDEKGKIREEQKVIKFESFVFDVFPKGKSTMLLETKREEEYAPVKTKEGLRSPENAIKAQVRLFKQWLKEANINLSDDCIVEISPLTALTKEECKKKLETQDKKELETKKEIYL